MHLGNGGEYGGFRETSITGYTGLIYFDFEGKVIYVDRKKVIPVLPNATNSK